MKLWQPAVAVLALGICAPAFAASQTVSYTCQQGQKVNVRYQFDADGNPLSAAARVGGASRFMKFDSRHSDNVSTAFKDARGYALTAGDLNADNVGSANGISIMSPKSEILFKDCSPKRKTSTASSGRIDASEVVKRGSVAYVCQDNRRLNVSYGFNAAGIPVYAQAKVQGRNYKLPYNLDRSDRVDTVFSGSGYTLTAGYVDSKNYRSQSGIMLTSPRDELLYKECRPLR